MLTFSLPWISIALGLASLLPQPPACGIPGNLFERSGGNLFTAEQERYLGEAIAEHIEDPLGIVRDEPLNAPLRKIGEHLARQMPNADVQFEFYLVDLPFTQAFALPGGRVYVSRKLVGFARSVDELAYVLGHEMGHVASGHTSSDYSDRFRQELGVEQLKDRADVLRRYRELARSGYRPGRGADAEHERQVSADRIGVLAAAAAGFDPAAATSIWDRVAQTEGKKGNWLTDILRNTRPESKRLREMNAVARDLPVSCRSGRPSELDDEFQSWKEELVLYTRRPGPEMLPGLSSRARFSPALRPDLSHLRFSPDGRFLAAQDEAGVYLYRREGLYHSFRVDAEDSARAHFSADSRTLWFHTRGLKIHELSLDEGGGLARHRVREVFRRDPCSVSELSPDGRTVACQGLDGDFLLYDVATGEVLFHKKEFFRMTLLDLLLARKAGPNVGFSPDGRTLIAAYAGIEAGPSSFVRAKVHYVAFDLAGRREIDLEGSIRDRVGRGFVFQSPDRIVGVHLEPKKSAIVTFPEGKVVEELALGFQSLDLPARGNLLFLRPVNKAAVGVMDLTAKKIVLASPKPAFDVHENLLVNQLGSGELELADHQRRETVATAELPTGPLGALVAAAVSPDFRFIAVSGGSRGGVWSTETGERKFETRAFHAAWFDESGRLYADFPHELETERMIGILETSSGKQFVSVSLGESTEFQRGSFLFDWKDKELAARSVRSGALLWRLPVKDGYPLLMIEPEKNSLLVIPNASSDQATTAFKSDPELEKKRQALGDGARLVEAYQLSSAKLLARVVVPPGRVTSGFASGDTLFLSDGDGLVLGYSLRDGSPQGTWFGSRPTYATSSRFLAIQTSTYQVALYEPGAFEPARRYAFPGPVSHLALSEDGTRLLVLTADQSVYLFDASLS
jgi:hypothetical protein